MPVNVLHVGLGPIGAGIVAQALRRGGFAAAGAVDVDPALAGRDLGELLGLGRRAGVTVTADLAGALRAARPDVAVVCTSSSIARVVSVLEPILDAKVPIVSTTEELAYPVRAHAAAAARIDALARRAGVAVLATGVNPGFAMDVLPIVATAVCADVRAIAVERVQDARTRRAPFQRKIGAGLSPGEFAARVKAGTIGHVGLAQSIAMIADAVGWTIDRVTDEIAPKIAEARIDGGVVPIEPGVVCGLVQEAAGSRNGEALVTLRLEAYLGAPASYDVIRIAGTPPITLRVDGGIPGDVAPGPRPATAVAGVR